MLAAGLYKAGYKGNFMGGDAITSSDFIAGAGRHEGMLATSIGQPLGDDDRARNFVGAYDAAGFPPDSYGSYGPLAYDAGTVLIKALGRVLPQVDDVQEARPRLIQAIDDLGGVDGVTGRHTFDEFGDTTNRTLTISEVSGGEWHNVFSGQYHE